MPNRQHGPFSATTSAPVWRLYGLRELYAGRSDGLPIRVPRWVPRDGPAVSALNTWTSRRSHPLMAVEIACGNCGNTFGVEAEWANLIVQCPFCSAAVQVPAEVANWTPATSGPGDQPESPAAVEPQDTTPQVSTPQVSAPQVSVPQVSLSPAPPPAPSLAVDGGSPLAIDWRAIAPDVPASKSQAPDFSRLALDAETAAPPPAGQPSSAPADVAGSNRSLAATAAAVSTAQSPTSESIPVVPPEAPVPVTAPVPPWTSPPTCIWLAAGNTDAIRVVVNEGTTTIRYQGQRVVLRAEPTAGRWYGLTSFVLSIVTLVILLTWMYFVYR